MEELRKWYEQYIEEAKNPNWEEFDKDWKHVHDWRTYTNYAEDVRKNWASIPLIGRCAVIACCEEAASNEEWE